MLETVSEQFVKRGVPGVDLSNSQLRSALGQADTVGGKVNILRRYRKIDTDLSDDEIGELTRFLRQTDGEWCRTHQRLRPGYHQEVPLNWLLRFVIHLDGYIRRCWHRQWDAPEHCIDADRFRRALKQSVVKNGNVDSVDAADAIDTITGYDGPKQQRVALLIQRTKGSGGAEFLADASDSTIDDVLSFEVDVDNPAYEGLQERVRVGIVRQYSRNKLDTDNWGGDLYPNAEDGTEVAAGIANDIDALDDSEKIKDLSDLLAREGGGPYMSGDPPDRLFKGAALEVRTARHLLEEGELNSNDRLRLSYKPENFESRLDNFNDDDLEAIAKRVYSSNDDSNVDKVEEILNLNDDSAQDVRPEFDALERSGNDGSSIIYYESKNFKDYSRATDDIAQSTEQNLVRLFTDRLVDANSNLGRDELDNVDVNLAVKSENGKETLISEINRNWLDEDQIIVPDKGS